MMRMRMRDEQFPPCGEHSGRRQSRPLRRTRLMTACTIVEDPRWEALALGTVAERATAATLSRLGRAPGHFGICLLGCDDARMAALNTGFRGKPHPTNVLSWPSEERRAKTPGEAPALPEADPNGLPRELGDIAIAYETCAREAREAGKSMTGHVTHLIVHGTLHLLSYDHTDDRDAALMEALEIKILGKLGISDPYEG